MHRVTLGMEVVPVQCPHCGGEVKTEFDLIGEHFGEEAEMRAYVYAHRQFSKKVMAVICRQFGIRRFEMLRPEAAGMALVLAKQVVAESYARHIVGPILDEITKYMPYPAASRQKLLSGLMAEGGDIPWAQLSTEEVRAKLRELMGDEGPWRFVEDPRGQPRKMAPK